ncbi:hypothetical protein Q9L58_007566 [Maublancomyces gigas]|uniref:UBX domain-containing protein n=1 Tax=Discina gigas TaxID=1032678 RepID=A0ABR3GC47_9PEZI
MASNVIVIYNQRRSQIKVQPTRSLSDVHTEACKKFNLDPLRYTLKRGQTTLDLSLQIRFTNLGPGAKLELVASKNTNSPIAVVLRIQDNGPTSELSDTFVSSDTIWEILRRFETKTKGLNITEKYASSATQGSGRLLYQMPAVRVVNKELVTFIELQQSLIGLGVREGRLLVVLRFKSTDIPYEEALEEIAKFSPKKQEEALLVPEEEASGSGSGSSTAAAAVVGEKLPDDNEDTDIAMEGVPPSLATEETEPGSSNLGEGSSSQEAEVGEDGQNDSKATVDPEKPTVSVYRPSESSTPAAAQIDVPETAYDIGISEAKIIQQHLKKAAIGRRLPSDKEIEEKEAAAIAVVEKVQTLVIKVRFPDSYTSEQTFQAKHTAQDLYDTIRTTMRHPFEPFYLMIPPKEIIPEGRQRLTIDLRIRSGASVHLIWGPDASKKARSEPALNDEYIKTSKSLPELKQPDMMDVDEGSSEGSGKGKGKGKGVPPVDRQTKENKLKSLLGFGRKK